MSKGPRELYQKLASMASNTTATDAERKSAREHMARLVQQHGETVQDWGREVLVPASPADEQLILHAAATHRCKVHQEPYGFIIEGVPDAVSRVKEDYVAYSGHLKNILQVALIGALKGFGVYCEGPEQGTTKEEVKPTFPYVVQQHVTNLFGAANYLGRHFLRPDYTLKQLPAPKPVPRTAPDPRDASYVPARFRGNFADLLGTTEIGGRTMEVRGNMDQEFFDAVFGKKKKF